MSNQTTTMTTLADIKSLCEARSLNIDCILNYAAKASAAPAEWFRGLDDQERADFLLETIEEWSRTEEQIDHLRIEHGCWAWAETRSHAIGKTVAKRINTEPMFAKLG